MTFIQDYTTTATRDFLTPAAIDVLGYILRKAYDGETTVTTNIRTHLGNATATQHVISELRAEGFDVTYDTTRKTNVIKFGDDNQFATPHSTALFANKLANREDDPFPQIYTSGVLTDDEGDFRIELFRVLAGILSEDLGEPEAFDVEIEDDELTRAYVILQLNNAGFGATSNGDDQIHVFVPPVNREELKAVDNFDKIIDNLEAQLSELRLKRHRDKQMTFYVESNNKLKELNAEISTLAQNLKNLVNDEEDDEEDEDGLYCPECCTIGGNEDCPYCGLDDRDLEDHGDACGGCGFYYCIC